VFAVFNAGHYHHFNDDVLYVQISCLRPMLTGSPGLLVNAHDVHFHLVTHASDRKERIVLFHYHNKSHEKFAGVQ
jgi:hypothetical protein